MKKIVNINIWDIFWRLIVIKQLDSHVYPSWTKRRKFLCRCECWNIKEILSISLINKKTKSCWCLKIDKSTKLWLSRTRIYKIWTWIKARCDNEKSTHYSYYWWRWITYDKKWENFEWFYEDMKEWYSDNLSIDRINSNKNYCKENCRWTTRKQQQRNMKSNRVYKWKCIAEWCEELGLNDSTIRARLREWWSYKKALFTKLKTYE